MAKQYLFYACYKNSRNGGMYCEGKRTMYEALNDLQGLIRKYANNDIIYIGVIKCADGNPLGHIYSLN